MDKKHNQRHWQDQTLKPTHVSRNKILWQPTLQRSSKASRATVATQTSSYQQQADQMSMQTGRMAGWQVGDMQGRHKAGTQNTLQGRLESKCHPQSPSPCCLLTSVVIIMPCHPCKAFMYDCIHTLVKTSTSLASSTSPPSRIPVTASRAARRSSFV